MGSRYSSCYREQFNYKKTPIFLNHTVETFFESKFALFLKILKEPCQRIILNSRSQVLSFHRSRWRSPFKCDGNRTRIYLHCGYTVQDRLNRKFSTSKQIFQLVLSQKLVVPGWESFETIPKNWANWSIVEFCIKLGKQKEYESSIKKEFSVIWNWVWRETLRQGP